MRVIVLEGVNAAGKSLVGRVIRNAIQALGLQCLVVDPAGFGRIGTLLRERIVDPSFHHNPDLDAVLFAALRAEGAEYILQSVGTASAITVVLERWSLALAAYGTADGARPRLVSELRAVLHTLLAVDMTILLNVSGEIAFERLARTEKQNRFEMRGKEYLDAVAQSYCMLAQQEQGTKVIDASANLASVCEQLRTALVSSWPEFENVSFGGAASERHIAQLDLNL
jgi:dTMP kinase